MLNEDQSLAISSVAELSVLASSMAAEVASLDEESWRKLGSERHVDAGAFLEVLVRELRALVGELSTAGREQTRLAAARLEVAGKIGLHVGCRDDLIPGWINVDASGGDLRLNLLRELPFDDDTFDLIYCAHSLEHFHYPQEVEFVLSELRRVLKPEGTIRVVVPDLEVLLRAYAVNDVPFFEARRRLVPIPLFAETKLEDFLHYAGAGAPPGLGIESHKFGYDFETLTCLFDRCGYASTIRSAYQASADPRLLVDNYSRSVARSGGMMNLSLFVEATR